MFDLSKILDLRKNLLFPTPCLNRKTTVLESYEFFVLVQIYFLFDTLSYIFCVNSKVDLIHSIANSSLFPTSMYL